MARSTPGLIPYPVSFMPTSNIGHIGKTFIVFFNDGDNIVVLGTGSDTLLSTASINFIKINP